MKKHKVILNGKEYTWHYENDLWHLSLSYPTWIIPAEITGKKKVLSANKKKVEKYKK